MKIQKTKTAKVASLHMFRISRSERKQKVTKNDLDKLKEVLVDVVNYNAELLQLLLDNTEGIAEVTIQEEPGEIVIL